MNISTSDLQVLREALNGGVRSAAELLNLEFKYSVRLDIPSVDIIETHPGDAETIPLDEGEVSVVAMPFSGAINGMIAVLCSPLSASHLVVSMIGEEEIVEDMDTLRVGVMEEVCNVILNGVMAAVSKAISQVLTYVPPEYHEADALGFTLEMVGNRTGLLCPLNYFFEEKSLQGDMFLVIRFNREACLDTVIRGSGKLIAT